MPGRRSAVNTLTPSTIDAMAQCGHVPVRNHRERRSRVAATYLRGRGLLNVHANARARRPEHLKDIHAGAPLANLSPIQRCRIENVSRDYVAHNFRDLGSHDAVRNSDGNTENVGDDSESPAIR